MDGSSAKDLVRPHQEQLNSAREAFGRCLVRWRRINGWSQQTPEQWGREAGFYYMHNSQWSRLERGDMGMPGPLLFRALGVLNDRIARQDWGRITTASLRDRVCGSVGVLHPDGTPWTGSDFYSAFIGEKDWPPFPKRQTRVSKAEADAWNRQLRLWFEEITSKAGLLPLAGLNQLMEHVPEAYEASMQHAVMGLGGLSRADLEELAGEDQGPEQWLKAWQESLGLKGRLEKGAHWRHVSRLSEEDAQDDSDPQSSTLEEVA